MKGLKTVFLITDTQIKEEAFLEDVDSVLNTGEVPNLFAADEKQEVMEVSVLEVHISLQMNIPPSMPACLNHSRPACCAVDAPHFAFCLVDEQDERSGREIWKN